MKTTWTEQAVIQSDDADFRSECRWSSMLSLMQRAADSHIESLGVSRQQMLEQGLGWMLITLDISLDLTPVYGEELELETWSAGTKGALWHRNYRFRNGAGQAIGSARTIWALVDIHKRKMLRPSAFPYEVPVHHESAGDPPDKKVIPDGIMLEDAYVHQVRYSGIDSNGHLNNARYADLCWDTLTKEELERSSASGFRITYLHEARLGDEMRIKRSPGADGTVYVKGESPEGTNFFEAEIRRGSGEA